jgi:hypothetical protein
MKKTCALLAVCSMGLALQAAPSTVVVDDFSSLTLTPYTQTVVLQNGASAVDTFSAATGGLTVSKASGTTPYQVLFLRNDYTLGVGQTLRVGTAVSSSANYCDFGIAVSATASPTAAVYTGANISTRQDYIAMYFKAQKNSVGCGGFNSAIDTSIGSYAGVNNSPDAATVLGLFISHTALNAFTVGYTTASGDVTTLNYTGVDASIGNAIGFYADLRNPFTYGTLDNLTITTVPEPTTLALCGTGLLGLVMVIRRKK